MTVTLGRKFKMLIPIRPLITRGVNMGPRKIASDFIDESSDKLLENGRNLRKSKDLPIKCRLILNRIWRMSESYPQHWQPYFAIIPADGITRKGYVKEVWVEAFSKPIEIDNHHYDLIDPYVHDTEQWIEGFEMDNVIQVLPSPKIMVKYYRHSRENKF